MKPYLKNFLLLALLCAFGLPAQAWWNADWTVRKKITLDTSATGTNITEPIGTTVVLVRLHDGDFSFSSAKDDGSDIRFIAGDDKTPLNYEIEKYDSLLGEAFVWVKVPDLKPGASTTIWLYYGNTGNGAAPGGADAKATYDNDTVLVYHFAGQGAPAHDSTKLGNDSQNPVTTVNGSLIGPGPAPRRQEPGHDPGERLPRLDRRRRAHLVGLDQLHRRAAESGPLQPPRRNEKLPHRPRQRHPLRRNQRRAQCGGRSHRPGQLASPRRRGQRLDHHPLPRRRRLRHGQHRPARPQHPHDPRRRGIRRAGRNPLHRRPRRTRNLQNRPPRRLHPSRRRGPGGRSRQIPLHRHRRTGPGGLALRRLRPLRASSSNRSPSTAGSSSPSWASCRSSAGG